MSISMSVDDTFSFIHRGRRTRVDSDASSFYFKSPSSMISVTSNTPPVSLYNRSHGGYRRSDSSTSVRSVAYSYAMHGANGGRAPWAKHNRGDPSLDSIMSDYSAMYLGRPGLGDKMLDSVFDHGMPLMLYLRLDERFDNRSSYDSIMDTRRSREDSLSDRTGARNASSSDDPVFFEDSRPLHSNWAINSVLFLSSA
jgi:serine/arginine repetitive matrix protein 2